MDIRRAVPADLPAVAAIYGARRARGTPPSTTSRATEQWEEKLTGPDHFLVAEHDGEVVGWVSAAPYRPKPAYVHTRESTVYVAPGHQGLGVGRQMYDALLALLRADGVHAVVAGVALPNPASQRLHEACGFEQVGVMRQVGRKFDRWIDLAWYSLVLA